MAASSVQGSVPEVPSAYIRLTEEQQGASLEVSPEVVPSLRLRVYEPASPNATPSIVPNTNPISKAMSIPSGWTLASVRCAWNDHI